MKRLVCVLIFSTTCMAKTKLTYCGNPVPNIVSENNIHIIVENSNNTPSEVVIADSAKSREIFDELNELDSDYLCLEGNLILEETVYFLEKITKTTFYK